MSSIKKASRTCVSVKQLIKSRGIQPGNLSYYLKMKKETFLDMLSGKKKWPYNVLWKIAEFFDLEVDDLTENHKNKF